MLKELKKDNNRIFYTDGEIIFYVWNRDNNLNLEKVQQKYNQAQLPDYIPKTMEELKQEPFKIFHLTIFTDWVEIKPENMSLWEYEIFINKNNNVSQALKSAFINKIYNDYYISCESFDEYSMLTHKNLNIIENYLVKHKQKLLSILNTDFLGFEVYN